MSDPELLRIADAVVKKTLKTLPPDIRVLAEGLPVYYEDIPDEDAVADGIEPDSLGMFCGDPHGTELSRDLPMPPQIFLFLENLWDFAEGDTSTYREEVRITYLHELGHYLGWDEDEVAERGLE